MELADAVPVDCRSLVRQVVDDGDDELVAPACFDLGAWELAVEDLGVFGHSVGVDDFEADIDGVLNQVGECDGVKRMSGRDLRVGKLYVTGNPHWGMIVDWRVCG